MANYRIPDLVKQYTDHEMIRLHTELPEFPELRSKLLYTFLNKNRLYANFSELYSHVTSLVQMGLDTHDMVTDLGEMEDTRAVRSRQLKILAGDYFSSNFYYLLSQAGEISVIKQLSTAICEVNRMKMNLYLLMKKAKLSAEEYIRQSVEIKSHLFLAFTHHFHEQYYEVWPKLLQSFTHCEVLVNEILRSETLHQFQGGWAFWHLLQHGTKEEAKHLSGVRLETSKLKSMVEKYGIAAQLHELLDQQWKQVHSLVERLDSSKLREEIMHIGEPLRRFVTARKVLEEI